MPKAVIANDFFSIHDTKQAHAQQKHTTIEEQRFKILFHIAKSQ